MTPADPADDVSNNRLADLMIRLENSRAFKLTPLAVCRLDGPHARLIVSLPDGARVDLSPEESRMAALMLRAEQPYPDFEAVARRFDAGATCAALARENMAALAPSGLRQGFAA